MGGTPVEHLTEADIHERRLLIVDWFEWACGWPPPEPSGLDAAAAAHREVPGVDEDDERYIIVTEGLDPGSFHIKPDPVSSCAMLPHFGFFRVGVREPWIDRKEAPGGWRGDGLVLARLVQQSRPFSLDTQPPLDGGDVVIIANDWPRGRDAHVVCCITELNQNGRRILCTAEYGRPGGELDTHDISRGFIGRRKIQARLDFPDILTQAFVRGLLVEPEPPPASL